MLNQLNFWNVKNLFGFRYINLVLDLVDSFIQSDLLQVFKLCPGEQKSTVAALNHLNML